MPIIASEAAKHTAPSAVHGVGSRASSAAHTIAPSTAMYSVTGTAIPSASSCGQNHTSRPRHAATTTPAATSRPVLRRTSGISAARKNRWAIRNADSPSRNDISHHGSASRKSPAAENTSAAISRRRSRGTGCQHAATASSTAVSAFTAGCNTNCPVSSAPAGTRRAVTIRNNPYATPAASAATHSAVVWRRAYGVAMSNSGPVSAAKPGVDPTLLKVLEAVPFQIRTDDGVAALRQQFRDLPRRPVYPEVLSEDRRIDGPAGPIPVRLYRPPNTGDRRLPVVVFLHGGGWSIGDLDSYDGTAREHAAVAEALVVSVDYRLAPEHPYPAAVEDCWAAVRWTAAHAAELGGDPARIAVAGDSAGGNLSAVMALL